MTKERFLNFFNLNSKEINNRTEAHCRDLLGPSSAHRAFVTPSSEMQTLETAPGCPPHGRARRGPRMRGQEEERAPGSLVTSEKADL